MAENNDKTTKEQRRQITKARDKYFELFILNFTT